MSAANGRNLDALVGRFRCILSDPPWKQEMSGVFKNHGAGRSLPYPTMELDEIKGLPVGRLAADGCHLWLWTTNAFLEAGFDVMRAWGFKYLAPIHWVKPSGIGVWFIHRTQTILFGYKGRCEFPAARMLPNIIETGNPRAHSAKPDATYRYIESVSPGPRLEMFARPWTPLFEKRDGWETWGNEMANDVELSTSNARLDRPDGAKEIP